MNNLNKPILDYLRAGKVDTIILVFISIVLFFLIVSNLKTILLPPVYALMLTFITHPLYLKLRGYKIPKVLTILLLVIIIFITGYLFILLMIAAANSFIGKGDFYEEKFLSLIASLLEPFNLTIDGILSGLSAEYRNDMGTILGKIYSSGIIQNALGSFSSILTDSAFVFLYWAFMISGKSAFEKKLDDIFRGTSIPASVIFRNIDLHIQRYLVSKSVMSLLMAFIATVGMMIIGVDMALFWGLITFLFHFIPNIGSLVAVTFPVIVSLLQFGLSKEVLIVTILLLANQFIIGNIVEPKVFGKHLDLSPALVLFALFFWGWLWGIPGMFLSVPLTAVIKIICENIESLKPLSQLMGGNIDRSW